MERCRSCGRNAVCVDTAETAVQHYLDRGRGARVPYCRECCAHSPSESVQNCERIVVVEAGDGCRY